MGYDVLSCGVFCFNNQNKKNEEKNRQCHSNGVWIGVEKKTTFLHDNLGSSNHDPLTLFPLGFVTSYTTNKYYA